MRRWRQRIQHDELRFQVRLLNERRLFNHVLRGGGRGCIVCENNKDVDPETCPYCADLKTPLLKFQMTDAELKKLQAQLEAAQKEEEAHRTDTDEEETVEEETS